MSGLYKGISDFKKIRGHKLISYHIKWYHRKNFGTFCLSSWSLLSISSGLFELFCCAVEEITSILFSTSLCIFFTWLTRLHLYIVSKGQRSHLQISAVLTCKERMCSNITLRFSDSNVQCSQRYLENKTDNVFKINLGREFRYIQSFH